MKDQKKIELGYNNIVKETEKAICLNLIVSWNGNSHCRDIWFPKSVCELVTFVDSDGNERTNAMVADWFLSKTESAKAFKGYAMRFETAFWN